MSYDAWKLCTPTEAYPELEEAPEPDEDECWECAGNGCRACAGHGVVPRSRDDEWDDYGDERWM